MKERWLDNKDLMDAFTFLDELREIGSTNMYGAKLVMVREMGWDKDKADKAITLWLEGAKDPE